MSATYGNQFADKWGGVKLEEMKSFWSRKLATLTPQQIMRGIETLDQCQFPPNLPEFMRLCKQAVPEAHVLKLSKPKLTHEQKEEGLRKLTILKGILKHEPIIEKA